jgi:hypothetical protein
MRPYARGALSRFRLRGRPADMRPSYGAFCTGLAVRMIGGSCRAWEVVMPVIVVTRLRLRDPAILDEFFAAAVAVLGQAKNSDGNLGADVLADANNAWWTVTGWQERGPMLAFVGGEPHLSTMARLDEWCDEAAFVDWEQDSPDLPDWQTSYRRLVSGGQVPDLTHASDAHESRAFPAPVEAA